MNDLCTVTAIRAEVARLRLKGRDIVMAMSLEELAKCYNGTGPEFLPPPIRQKLDEVCRPFLPAVMVHDVDFDLSDGSVGAFQDANSRLLRNSITCANDAYPAINWQRYALYAEGYALYRACEKFGWIAWLSAYNKNPKQTKGNI